MSVDTRIEYGVICDRTPWGLGRVLLRTAYSPESAWKGTEECFMKAPHVHRLHLRQVTCSEWSDAIDEQGMKEAQIARDDA